MLAGGLLVLAFVLAALSKGFAGVQGWFSFLMLLALGAALVWAVWRLLAADDPPRWLLPLTLGAILLRLALAAFWLLALPLYGYDNPVNDAGYVMEDAHNRDTDAWALAQSDEPLSAAFDDYSAHDQYGGLLYLSAGVYRYLGGESHQPLLMVVLSATVSGLAVALGWALVKRAWGDPAATWTAWGVALYPEAALLGSSQMREAFSVTLIALAVYAQLRWHAERQPRLLAWVAVPVLLALPLSFPVALGMLGMLLLVWLALEKWRWLRVRWVQAGLLLGALAAIAYLLFAVDVAQLWLVQSADWQVYVSQNASGWVAREFERLPAWSQVPFIVVYGIFRPLLPAAIIAGSSSALWKGIIVWRALGWTALLALLLYASFLALRERGWRRLPGALLLANWVLVLVASYRGGGDDWDSPRYRAALAVIQIGLAAWALQRQRESRDPWLRRALVGGGLVIAWFVPWYLRRYAAFEWPIIDLDQVVGLGLASAVLYIFWDWLRA